MNRLRLRIDTHTANAVRDLLKSDAESRIYLFLLGKNGAKTDDIIRGTKLHPSTVRELLSKMFSQQLIYRKKLKTEHIGKNPYLYHAAPPRVLLKQYINELEQKLNRIANLDTDNKNNTSHYVHITFNEGGEDA